MPALIITADSFDDRPEGLFYLGPLDLGKDLVAQDRFVFEGPTNDGGYRVSLCDGETDDSAAEWGQSSTGDAEEAWRYALGAAIGPYDYDEPTTTLTWGNGEQSNESQQL